jgi:signal transduction histidine kinase
MAAFSDSLRRTAVSFLARSQGEVRARNVVRQLGEIGRIASVFAVTMLVPIAFLAFLALSSVRTEELSPPEADLRARAEAALEQLVGDFEAVFRRFELATKARFARGESPIANLGELSGYLRAAFRFDTNGNLAAPFDLPTPEIRHEPTAAWIRALREARRAEGTEDWPVALEAWRRAQTLADEPAKRGEAMLGEARALARLGRPDGADDLLTDLYADHATVREEHGFRLGDLARLELARLRIDQGDAETGLSALQDLVDFQLQTQWTIGRDGDPAVLREALRLLEGRADPDWVARSRSRLNERSAQLTWAELVKSELEIVWNRTASVGEFRYFPARIESPAVWATVRDADDSFYAFSFSRDDLHADLKSVVAAANAEDPELLRTLVLTDDGPPDAALASVPLTPLMGVYTLAVSPSDPEAVEASRGRRRTVRIAVVLTAVFVSVVGAFWIARLVAWEMETARQRADFAANVSHELRSPITQIRLKGEALALGLVDPGADAEEHYASIVRESERLSRLVDNVLDFASIERGVRRYQLRPDDLGDVLLGSVDAARSTFEAAGMVVDVDIPDDLPRVWFDREALGQVMTNLLSNAAKYGESGGWVRIAARAGESHVALTVADRGIGIVPGEIHRVFDDFFRSADPRVRSSKGTGIGLAIVRYIVEAHGGTIHVASTPGQGAVFTILLPLQPPEDSGEQN